MINYLKYYELKWLTYALIFTFFFLAQFYISVFTYFLFGGLICFLVDLLFTILHYRKLSTIDKYYDVLRKNTQAIDKLEAAISNSYEGEIIRRNVLKITNEYKNETNKLTKDHNDFTNYLELWLHETKLFVSNLKLLSADIDERRLKVTIEQLENNIERIIALNSSSSININAKITPCSILDIVNDSVKSQRNGLMLNHIHISMHNMLNHQVLTDDYWMKFIIKQVINNAIKYGATKIYIVFDPKTNRLQITDNGIGIDPKECELVFDKYYCSQRTKESYNSTGIGLFLVRNICEKLNMKVKILPQKDGITVSFTFPKNGQ